MRKLAVSGWYAGLMMSQGKDKNQQRLNVQSIVGRASIGGVDCVEQNRRRCGAVVVLYQISTGAYAWSHPERYGASGALQLRQPFAYVLVLVFRRTPAFESRLDACFLANALKATQRKFERLVFADFNAWYAFSINLS